jgi:hypothetical protein
VVLSSIISVAWEKEEATRGQMMRLKISAVIMALTMVLIGSSLAGAEPTITQVTHNTFEDIFPQIEDDYVVWQGRGGLEGAISGSADWEIFLYSIATGQTTPITDDSYDNLNPDTDGSYVVWWADKPSGAEVWLYDINIGEKKQISPPNANGENHYLPVIANGRVAWMGFTRGGVILREIWLYDCVTEELLPLTDNDLDDSSPRIDDNSIIWVRADVTGVTSLFIHYLGNVTPPAPVPDGFVWPDSPQTDGNLTVLTRYNGSDRDVFVYDSDLRSYEQVNPPNDMEDRDPHISGHHIVWVRGEGAASEIFLAECKYIDLVSPENGVVLPKGDPPTFTWDTIGYEKFKVQFSKAPDFPSKQTLTFPGGKKKWLSEAFFTPTTSKWSAIKKLERKNGYVYWRVKAKDADGNVAFSQAWGFSIE